MEVDSLPESQTVSIGDSLHLTQRECEQLISPLLTFEKRENKHISQTTIEYLKTYET